MSVFSASMPMSVLRRYELLMEAFGGDAHTADSAATLAAACRWVLHYLTCKASVLKQVLVSKVAQTRAASTPFENDSAIRLLTQSEPTEGQHPPVGSDP